MFCEIEVFLCEIELSYCEILTLHLWVILRPTHLRKFIRAMTRSPLDRLDRLMIDITTNRIVDRINMPYLILVGCVESLPSFFSQFKIVKLQKLVALKVYDPSSHNSKE